MNHPDSEAEGLPAQPLRLHLGCELNTPPGWINLDGSWGAWLGKHRRLRAFLKLTRFFPQHLLEKNWPADIVVHDLRKPLPFDTNSLVAIYACHVLEHLYLTEAESLLKECYRTLKPGAVIRIVVPDLEAYISEYLEAKSHPKPGGLDSRLNPGDLLNQRLMLRSEAPPAGKLIYKLYSILKDFHSHKWVYDANSLAYHLQKAGFINIGIRQPHESKIKDIEKIEQIERIVGGGGICLEGFKAT
jgi:predicted SAM-dependent methyltransferase